MLKANLAIVLTGAALAWAAATQAQYSGQRVQQESGLTITECSVYSDTDKALHYDCTAKAKESCVASAANRCELPIGLALTGGRDLDGNDDTWEKVVVHYRCGKADRINGPHHQNDHASMILECRGG